MLAAVAFAHTNPRPCRCMYNSSCSREEQLHHIKLPHRPFASSFSRSAASCLSREACSRACRAASRSGTDAHSAVPGARILPAAGTKAPDCETKARSWSTCSVARTTFLFLQRMSKRGVEAKGNRRRAVPSATTHLHVSSEVRWDYPPQRIHTEPGAPFDGKCGFEEVDHIGTGERASERERERELARELCAVFINFSRQRRSWESRKSTRRRSRSQSSEGLRQPPLATLTYKSSKTVEQSEKC